MTAMNIGIPRILFVTMLSILSEMLIDSLPLRTVVETIFMWDGVGKLAADAIQMRDYPLIQAYVVWMAVIYVAVNLAADLVYCQLDPRIRLGGDRP